MENKLEKKCVNGIKCLEDHKSCEEFTTCKHYQLYIMQERLGRIRSAEGLDYQDLIDKYEDPNS